MSRDDAALLHLVARHLADTEDVAELTDILDLLVERLGASGALLATFATSRSEPLHFMVGDAEVKPALEDLVARVRDSRQLVLVTSPGEPQLGLAGALALKFVGSALAIPVQGQPGHLIGVLAMTHAEREGLDESHVALLTAVAYQMASALRHVRLANEVRRRAYELYVLDEIGQAFSSLNLEQLLRLILERTCRALRVNRGVLFLFDEERQELILRAVYPPDVSGMALDLRVPLAERPHIADAIRTLRPAEVRNIYADPRLRDFWHQAQEMDLEASLTVPLIAKGQAIGAISLDRTIVRPPFTPAEISLCQIITNQAASALENARLYGETRRYAYEARLRVAELDRRAQRLALLNRISTALVRSLQVSQIAPTITEGIAQALDVPQSILFVFHPDGVTGQVMALYPPPEEDSLPIDVVLKDLSDADPLLEADAPLLIEDVRAQVLLEPVWPLLEERGIESLLVVPMAMAGQVQGLIGLDTTKRDEPFSAGDMELAMTIGNQVAFALANVQLYAATQHRAAENARLYQEAERLAYKLHLINEVSKEISSILDIDLLLRSVVRLILETLDCYHVIIALVEGDELVFKATAGHPEEDARPVDVRLRMGEEPEGITGWVAQYGEPLLVPDVTQEPRYIAVLGPSETRSEVVVPLRLGRRVIGVLDLQSTRVDGFDDGDVALLQSLAAQIAVAVENAHLFGVVHSERAKLEAIINGAEDVVVVTDEGGRVLLMNRAAEKAFRVAAGEAQGCLLLDCTANPDIQGLWGDSTQTTSYPLVGEIELDDGRTLYASVASVPQVGLVAVMQDISHLKDLDRMKSDFVSTVSHDLRSPLQAVRLNLEMLPKMGSLNPDQQEAVAGSLRVLERVTDLVRDLLDLGRIEAGVGLERTQCSLGEIIVAAVQDMQPRARMMDLNLEVLVSEGLPDVYGDANRLVQVVVNLVDNAIKYTSAGGQIRVMARQEDGEVLVEVQDDGPGIAPEDQVRLFEKFYRLPDVQHQQVEGTGLGLAIVKSIIDAHGGRVCVESFAEEEQHGSIFGFAIPIQAMAEGNEMGERGEE